MNLHTDSLGTDFLQTDAQAEERSDREAKQHQKVLNDIRWVMSGKQGRRFVYRLLECSGLFKSTFNTEALTMAFYEGQRNVALRQMAELLEACPNRYAEMLSEQNNKGFENDY